MEIHVDSEALLDRLCEVYGFTQKIQLARHFNIAASSLQNRYSRGTVSYDFAAHCVLEKGANMRWLLTGEGPKFQGALPAGESNRIELFTLGEGKLAEDGHLSIDYKLFAKTPSQPICVKYDGKTHMVEKDATLSDGTWLVDIEGSISIRDLTLLPERKMHVAGGKVPFECGVDQLKTLGRVVGIYTEVN